jgi:hypothetical protein
MIQIGINIAVKGLAIISSLFNFRVTESSDNRITESGDKRITE